MAEISTFPNTKLLPDQRTVIVLGTGKKKSGSRKKIIAYLSDNPLVEHIINVTIPSHFRSKEAEAEYEIELNHFLETAAEWNDNCVIVCVCENGAPHEKLKPEHITAVTMRMTYCFSLHIFLKAKLVVHIQPDYHSRSVIESIFGSHKRLTGQHNIAKLSVAQTLALMNLDKNIFEEKMHRHADMQPEYENEVATIN